MAGTKGFSSPILTDEQRAMLMGKAGTPGKQGSDGLSAYQIWIEQGNTGSQADFIASLKGAPGQNGAGTPGSDGNPGRGIAGSQITGGHLVLAYTDGSTMDVGQIVGAPGTPGEPGSPGSAGRGISGSALQGSSLIVTYTDGTITNVGVVVGKDGEPGKAGVRGSIWTVGSGAPTSSGNAGDLYLDTATGDVYQLS